MPLLKKKISLFGKNKPPRDNRPVTIPMPCLLVRFDIDTFSGTMMYGDACCELLLDAVPPEELEYTIVFCGDSDKTLAGLENVFIIAIADNEKDRLKKLLPMLRSSSELAKHCAQPPFELMDNSKEPLIMGGLIQNGLLENQQTLMAYHLKKRKK